MTRNYDITFLRITPPLSAGWGQPHEVSGGRHNLSHPLPTLRGVTHGEANSAGAPPRPRPSDRVRGLYRTLIKLCHPDLAADDADRLRREEFTARVNAAYAAKNAGWLAELAREWQAGTPHAATAPGQASELKTAIEVARRQLSEVGAGIARLTTTGLGELFGSEDAHAAMQRIADQVRAEIRRQRDVLRRLRG